MHYKSDQKFKVLIHSNYNPTTSYGGVELVVNQLLKALSIDSLKLTCICGDSKNEIFISNSVNYICRKVLFKLRGAPFLSLGNFTLLRYGIQSDLLIFQEPFPFLWPAIKILKFFYKTPTIVLAHADPAGPRFVKYLYRHLRNYIFSDCICVSTSPNVHEKIASDKFLSSSIIPLYVDKIKTGSPFSQDLSVPEKYVLFFGRISSYKGIDVLLEAAYLTPNVKYVIAGNGPLSYRVNNYISNCVNNNIVFLNKFISEDQKLILFQGCQFLVFPSTSENEAFGLVQLEAMRVGKPVINTDLDTGVNFVAPHMLCAITVPRSDAPALSAAIETLWGNPELVALLGDNALSRFNNLFTEESFVISWRNLIRGILK